MSVCPTCGQTVVVVTWACEATFDARVESANLRTVNGRDRASRTRYQRGRDTWMLRFRAATWTTGDGRGVLLAGAGASNKPRRVTFTRHYSGRQREMDHANMVGGMKYVVDAMVRVGLLVDDAPKWFTGIYVQQRSERSGLHVLIEEMAQ